MSFFSKGKKQEEPIPYVCDNCGANVTAKKEIPRCLGCGKNLCEICNNYLLCPQDFHILNKKDQKKIKQYGRLIQNARNAKVVFTVMPTIMGIAGAVLLLLMVIFDREMFYFLFGFLGGFLLFSAVMMFLMFHNIEERETKRISIQIREVLMAYNIKPVNQAPINTGEKQAAGGMSGEISSGIAGEISGDFKSLKCPSCGSQNTGVNLKYCEICGSTLDEKSID
jgi:hypothetical protein